MLYIEEIIRKMEQGKTEPYLCRDSNQEMYVVKRLTATFDGCIKEWICARLAKEFGLPIPPFNLAEIDECLVEYNYEHRNDLGEGIAFASKFVEDLQEVNYSLLNEVQIEVLKDLYVFDYWIKNADRTLSESGGNPNLFYKQSTNEIVVVDHNLAFDSDFKVQDHESIHVSARFWPEQLGLFDMDEYKSRMERSISFWEDIVSEIPEEWLELIPDPDGFFGQLKVILEKFNHNEFWEVL